MPLTELQDYVFVPGVNRITDKGVFIGTRDYFFCFPSRTVEHESRRVITTTYSFAGKPMHEAISQVIATVRSQQELEEQLMEMAKEIRGTVWYKIDDLGGFKVEANFLGSGIHINATDRRVGFKPFIQSLGKEKKKQIKTFYETHPKSR